MILFFWINVILLVYIYFGYYFLLKIMSIVYAGISRPPRANAAVLAGHSFPSISIIVPVYNEDQVVQQRIENLCALEYPGHEKEIIIASDGSRDQTAAIAAKFSPSVVTLVDYPDHRGKAIVQNETVKRARGELIVFTDADTVFDSNFLREIARPFVEDRVGCVVGNLIYAMRKTAISESEGFYWHFEKKIRAIESDLGILATGTGACMAVRKKLWIDLSPTDDSDFITPLDVVRQGFRVVYSPTAIAYDVPPQSIKGELKTRIRQTSKNLPGTLRRWGLRGWISFPLTSFGLISHKLLRWLGPFMMINIYVGNILIVDEGFLYQMTLVSQSAFYALSAAGFISQRMHVRIPLASLFFSFCVANLGIAIGVITGLLGRAPAKFKNEE